MKIISWNCNGAFRKKNEKILGYKPDLIVVSECENPERMLFNKLTPKPNDHFWIGDLAFKGIGVFSYSHYKIELLDNFNPKFRYVIPLKITGHSDSFVLFAIWAMDNKQERDARYIGQIWRAINYYDKILEENLLLIGDFNSNQIWDRKRRIGNHSHVVGKLKDKGIESLYHKKYQEEHGQEKIPTQFMYRNLEKPYHIDYCFGSIQLIQNGFNLDIGKAQEWIDLSDHMPIFVEIDRIT